MTKQSRKQGHGHGGEREGQNRAMPFERVAFAAVLFAVGCAIVLFYFTGLEFGKPFRVHNDEYAVCDNTLEILSTGSYLPEFLGYPQLHTYLLLPVFAFRHLTNISGGKYRANYWNPNAGPVAPSVDKLNEREKFSLYVAARLLNAMFATGILIATFLIASYLFNRWIAVLSMLWILAEPTMIRQAHYAVPNILVGLILVCTAACCIQYMKTDKLRFFYAAAILAGLAFSAKYSPTGALCVVLTGVIRYRKTRWPHLIGAVATCVLATIASYPSVVFDLPRFLKSFGDIMFIYKWAPHAGHAPPSPALAYLRSMLRVGPFYMIPAWLGLAFLVVRKRPAGLVVAAFPVLGFLLMVQYASVFDRNLTVIFPFLGLAFGASVYYLWAGLTRLWQAKGWGRPWAPAAICGLAACLVLAGALGRSYAKALAPLRVKTTFTMAQEALEQQIPPGSSVLCDKFWPRVPLPLEDGRFQRTLVEVGRPYAEYLEGDYYISTASAVYDANPAIREVALRTYEQATNRVDRAPMIAYLEANNRLLAERLQLVKFVRHLPPAQGVQVSPYNYDISIYRVPRYKTFEIDGAAFGQQNTVPDASKAVRLSSPGQWTKEVALERGTYDIFVEAACHLDAKTPYSSLRVRVNNAEVGEIQAFSRATLLYHAGMMSLGAGGPALVGLDLAGPLPVSVARVLFVQTRNEPSGDVEGATVAYTAVDGFRNGKFMQGNDGLAFWHGKKDAAANMVVEDVVSPGGSTRALRIDLEAGMNLGIRQSVPKLTPQATYIVKGRLKCQDLAGMACLEVQDAQRGFKGFMVRSNAVSGTQDWQDCSVVFTPPPEVEGVTVFLRRPAPPQDDGTSGQVWFADIEMYRVRGPQ